MEMYDTSEHGNAETYMIQGSQSTPLSTASLIEHIETMYNEGAPEFVVDHGMYYPTTASYGYYCTGFESPGDWGDQHRVFTVDGPDVQYQGAEIENLPYVYYTPSYGYAQSPYNPYNPYIPGAVVGLDGSFAGPQQYITNPQYQDCVPSSYYPLANGQCRPEALLNTPSKPLVHNDSTLGNRPKSHLPKNNLSSSSAPFTMIASESPLNHPKHFPKVTDGTRANSRPSQPSAYGRSNYGSTPTVDKVLNSRGPSHNNQLIGAVPAVSDPAATGPVSDEQSAAEKSVPELNQDRGYGVKITPTVSNDENSKDFNVSNKLIVKAYTSRISNADAEGNITIHTDQYNKEDLPVDYVNAKFFVIKSYSEDDVHKSIKYNVWSSTPNGNKKLSNAYEDAQSLSGGIPGGCPLFLFFSVNASGQFCGVAEMVGRVDFNRDMDFWQQDKWSGSFPVKWHIIKDVPNSNFRHITLANNENKPVTNSRDTQEISFTPGLEMLKIFKNHKLKTSVLDDFMYYESRQKVIREGRTKLLTKTNGTPVCGPALEPPWEENGVVECPSAENEKTTSIKPTVLVVAQSVSENDIKMVPSSTTGDGINVIGEQNESEVTGEIVSTLMIGSLAIESKGAELKARNGPPAIVHPKPVETVTIDSLHVKVNGLSGFAGPLTFGSLPADIKGFKKKSRK
uniref:YTH domain-containing family protein n=2 Tax=Kalanchoe fedtschenkoi TaxID=63787 RepID=A0A7N0T6Y9_KALFE